MTSLVFWFNQRYFYKFKRN